MDSTVITIIVKDIIVPEVLALLHRRMAADPTDDNKIIIQLSKDSADVKSIGQAFLDSTRSAPPAGAGVPVVPVVP